MTPLNEMDESGNEFAHENETNNGCSTSHWKNLYKNRKQTTSVSGGLTLMLISGLHIGWGIWRVHFDEPWMEAQTRSLFIFIKISWYVTAIIGGFIGSALVLTLRKNMIYYISATLLIISSLCYIVLYDEHVGIIVGRCIAGLAHGIAYLTTIIHASENSAKEIRGTILSLINVMMFVSITISAAVIVTVTYDHRYHFNSDRVIGIIALVFSIGAIFCTFLLTKESVPYLLLRNKELEALEVLKALRGQLCETCCKQLIKDMQQLKSMVHEDQHDGMNIFRQGNTKPLILMITLYTLGALTNNYLINIILFNFLALAIEWPNFMLAPTILAAVRGGVGIMSVFLADILDRKMHIAMTGLTLLTAIIVVIIVIFTSPHIWVIGSFAIAFQIFVAIGVDPIQHTLLSEAFSSSKKSWSISTVTAFENLIQILFIGMYFMDGISSSDAYILVACCILFILVLVSILQLTLPETRGMSLKEARNEFRANKCRKNLCSGYNNLNCGCRQLT